MSQGAVDLDVSVARTRRGPSRRARRYVLLGGLAAAALLVASTGAAFLAQNGNAGVSVTETGSTSAGSVYSAGTSSSPGSLPTGTSSFYVPTTWETGSTAPVSPAWSVTQGQPTTVTTAGDVAIVDGTGGETMITVALTDAAAMAGAYSYVNIPIEVYTCTASATGCSWSLDSSVPESYLTFSNAALTFDVPGGSEVFYEIVVPTGGSMYPYSIANSSDLGATFAVSASVL